MNIPLGILLMALNFTIIFLSLIICLKSEGLLAWFFGFLCVCCAFGFAVELLTKIDNLLKLLQKP